MAFQIQKNDTKKPVEYPDFTTIFNEHEIHKIEDLIETTIGRLLQSKSFVKKDFLVQIVKKETPLEIQNKPSFDLLIEKVLGESNLAELGGGSNYGWITQQKLLQAEQEMLDLASHETTGHLLNKDLVKKAIERKKGISEEQVDAVWAACDSKQRVTVIEGAAGAGKSFTMQAIKEAFAESGYAILGAALSWNAAKVLEESASIPNCESIEGLIRKIEQARKSQIAFFRRPTLLIIDEAGLVGTRHMWRLLKEVSIAGEKIKVVLTGDSTQLSPVDAGSALEAIVDHCGSTRIDTIRRQKQESHRRAVRLFADGHAGKALYVYQQQEMINWGYTQKDLFDKIVTDYISYKLANPNKKSLVLALSNKDVQVLNQLIRECYKNLGFITGKEYPITLTDMQQSWQATLAVGDRIVFRKNDKKKVIYQEGAKGTGDIEEKSTGLFNRTTGVIHKIEKEGLSLMLSVKLDGGGYTVVDTNAYMTEKGLPICHNFATTIYASQGQTVEKVFMIDSEMMNRRLAYVGMSRHTENCEIYLNVDNLTQRINKMLGMNNPSYSHKEMLQMVATTWAKEAKNQTTLMMMKDKREKKNKLDGTVNLEPDEKIVNYVDFIPEINKRYPEIDLQKLLKNDPTQTPDKSPTTQEVKPEIQKPSVAPVSNPTLIPQIPIKEVPKVQAQEKPTVQPTGIPVDQATLWDGKYAKSTLSVSDLFKDDFKTTSATAKLKNAVLNFFKLPDAPTPTPSYSNSGNSTNKSSASSNPSSYQKPKYVQPNIPALGKLPTIPSLPNKKVNIAYLEQTPLNGFYDYQQEKLLIDTLGKKPSEEFMQANKGKLWDIGRDGEIKILSSMGNKVVSRYNLDGVDKTKMFFPPLIANPKSSDKTPIFIISSALDMLYTLEFFQKTKEDKTAIPHFVWAAKEADLKLIAGGLKKRTIIIARSKTDETQIPWALETEDKLRALGIQAQIVPKIVPDKINEVKIKI